VNFANDPGDGRNSFGVSAGGMGGGVFGAEFDFGYSPNFFDEDSVFGKNNVLTAMGNLIIGIPFGGQRGAGLRPYVTGGVGLIRTDFDGLFEGEGSSSNDFGFNLGGGVMGFFSDHVGLRGDLRYFRTLESGLDEDDNLLPDFDLGNFDFWRASIGIVIR
jgi:opacity protein-like surface antigen